LAYEISSRLDFVWCYNYLCKILEQQIRRGLSAGVANDCGAQFYSNEEQFLFLLLICNQML
jgi:hypothetical protein